MTTIKSGLCRSTMASTETAKYLLQYRSVVLQWKSTVQNVLFTVSSTQSKTQVPGSNILLYSTVLQWSLLLMPRGRRQYPGTLQSVFGMFMIVVFQTSRFMCYFWCRMTTSTRYCTFYIASLTATNRTGHFLYCHTVVPVGPQLSTSRTIKI